MHCMLYGITANSECIFVLQSGTSTILRGWEWGTQAARLNTLWAELRCHHNAFPRSLFNVNMNQVFSVRAREFHPSVRLRASACPPTHFPLASLLSPRPPLIPLSKPLDDAGCLTKVLSGLNLPSSVQTFRTLLIVRGPICNIRQ